MNTDLGKELAAALVAAQSEMPMVSKGGTNTFDKYTYAKLDDYVRVIRPIFAKHGLSMLTSVESAEMLPTRKTKNGNDEHVARVKINLTIVHSTGQSITVSSFGEGQDRGDKGLYKAITGARKYALASALGLATSDDPEETGPQEPPPPQRATPPQPKAPDPRKALAAQIKAWSGVRTEDLADAYRTVAKRMGIDSKLNDLTPEQTASMAEYVTKSSATAWADWLKESSK